MKSINRSLLNCNGESTVIYKRILTKYSNMLTYTIFRNIFGSLRGYRGHINVIHDLF